MLDELLASGRVPQPQFMKLDVQGFELEVLKGATKMLQAAEVVLLEVSFTRFFPGLRSSSFVTRPGTERPRCGPCGGGTVPTSRAWL